MSGLNSKNEYLRASSKLSNHARSSILKAKEIAEEHGCKKIESIHLFFAIFEEKGSVGSNLLHDLGLKKENFQETILASTVKCKTRGFLPTPSQEFKKVFARSYSLAKELRYSYVGTEHLAYSLIESGDSMIKEIISQSDIKKMKKTMRSFFDPGQMSQISRMLNLPGTETKKTGKLASATPHIDKFCSNINQETKKKGEIIIGREKEIERIINILGRKNKNNPILVGDPGVGKTALISGLAQLINAGQVPPSLYRKRIMNLDVAQLIAGTSFRGEFESRLKEIIKEASDNQDIILFIDEIHNIVGAGNVAGSLDLANILKPALARGEMQLIGATTHSEFKKYIEKDAALERRFQPIYLEEPLPAEAEKILFGIRKNYENFHNVSISDEAVRLAVELSVRYIQNRHLPDKAIDVIDETASNIRSKNKVSDFFKFIKKLEDEKESLLEIKEKLVAADDFEEAIRLRSQEKELEEKISALKKQQFEMEKENRIKIEAKNIIETIAKISGIPEEKLAQAKGYKIKNIRKILEDQIVGQKEAIAKIESVILRSQSGISNPDRPLGSFLFLGPTGVGKTLTAKVLAREFFGSDRSLIRIDMSELSERHSVSSLIGSPAGYIGYGEGGNLTEKVRRNPYSVVLFDEIEKAHPDIFNILLQVLEDGILTDAEGTQVSFKNALIILTSNVGTNKFTGAVQVGFESDKKDGDWKKITKEKFATIKESAIKELEQKMRPELINRLDHIIVFNPLDRKEIEKIAKLEISQLKERTKKQGIALTIHKEAAKIIAEKSLSVNEGARLIRRNIQELIENKIAEMIIYDKVKKNRINIGAERGEIKIS